MSLSSRIPRRSFVGWLGAIAALLGVGARSRAHGAPAPDRPLSLDDEAPALQGAQAALDAAALTALAAVVLPGELGADGARKAARDFARYAASYRANAEVLHPYGSPRLSFTGATPVPRWRGQLDALQREARTRHRRAFAAVSPAERRALVESAIAGERTDRMPSPMSANHVALALVAWYFGTPEATDRCYGVRIGKNQCRPLVNSPKEPQPLARRATNSSGMPGNGHTGGAT